MLFDTAGVGGWEGFFLHGFTLRVSPAVTHGVSPPGTVGEHGGSLLFSTCPLCSALHPHPRLRMVCPRRGRWVSTEEVCFFPLVLYALRCILTRGYAWCVPAGDSGCVRRKSAFFHLSSMLCTASSPAVTHGVSPPETEGAYAEEFRPAYRVQSVDNFTHYDRHTESQQSSVSHATAHKSATAPVAEYLTPPAEVHHA